MANRLFKLLPLYSPKFQQVRFFLPRGKHPVHSKSLAEYLEKENRKARDPKLYFDVDIGLPYKELTRPELTKQWSEQIKKNRNDPELEKKSRHMKLEVDLDQVEQDWELSTAALHKRKVAKHFGIFEDLFGEAYFHPVVPLDILYDFGDEDYLAKVYTGNMIKPKEAKNMPSVEYKSNPNDLWTLLFTCPDGNLSDTELEYCHWFIGNIPGNDIGKGETLIDYMQPIPPRGLGFCRYIYILYKQDKPIDFSEYKKQQPCIKLFERNWSTKDFYRKYQDNLTPAGLVFFQSDYDETLKDFYHHTLDMEEPIFEYDFDPPYLKPQQWFPRRQPFNLYMDKYRDKKQINKEFLLKKLKKEHPFKFPEPPLKYPNAVIHKEYVPSWLKTEILKERLGWCRIKEYQ